MSKTVTIQQNFQLYETQNELPTIYKKLLKKAFQFARNAYAPYSNFNVGCAILLENGKIVGGTNQENASYPAGICAERTALSTAANLYPKSKPILIAVVTGSANEHPGTVTAPCGICRQSICEVEARYNSPIKILFPSGNGGYYLAESIKNLLPLSFKPNNLLKPSTND